LGGIPSQNAPNGVQPNRSVTNRASMTRTGAPTERLVEVHLDDVEQ
jgi:hypothetical protein